MPWRARSSGPLWKDNRCRFRRACVLCGSHPLSSTNAAPERLQHLEADGERGLSCTYGFIRAAPCRTNATGCSWSIKAGIKLRDVCSRAPDRGLQPRSPPTPGTSVSVWQSEPARCGMWTASRTSQPSLWLLFPFSVPADVGNEPAVQKVSKSVGRWGLLCLLIEPRANLYMRANWESVTQERGKMEPSCQSAMRCWDACKGASPLHALPHACTSVPGDMVTGACVEAMF